MARAAGAYFGLAHVGVGGVETATLRPRLLTTPPALPAPPAVFSDSVGDAGAAPDISKVLVSDDAATRTLRIDMAVSAFPVDAALAVYFDTDRNVATGIPTGNGVIGGAEYFESVEHFPTQTTCQLLAYGFTPTASALTCDESQPGVATLRAELHRSRASARRYVRLPRSGGPVPTR